jgi:hypothetical protein
VAAPLNVGVFFVRLRITRLPETAYPPDCYRYTDADAPGAGDCYARLVGGYWYFCESAPALDTASESGRFAQDSSVVKRFARECLAKRRRDANVAAALQMELFA